MSEWVRFFITAVLLIAGLSFLNLMPLFKKGGAKKAETVNGGDRILY